MSVEMKIGPAGGPPTTTFYFLDGYVTLDPRPETTRTPVELASIILRIELFARACRLENPLPTWAPNEYTSEQKRLEGEQDVVHCRFYAFEKFEQITTITLATQLIVFAERPEERTMGYSDFEAYVRHLKEILALARRPPP